MGNKHVYTLLALIFVAAFVLNSFVLFFKPIHEDAYFSLRYIETLKENLLPILSDDLSYGGRSIEEPFLFYYLIRIGSSFHDVFVRIIPALLISSLVLIIFLISRQFVSKTLALIPSLFAAFIPVMFKINTLSPQALAFPILFLLIYSFTKIEDKRFLYLFVALSFLLPLTSFLSIFYIFAILLYFFIVGIERKKISALEGEALLFSLFVNVFLTLFVFRDSLLAYGPSFIWQNIPSVILAEFFREFALIGTLGNIGIASLFLGAVGFLFSFREKNSIFLASFLISSLVFLCLRLVPFNIGLIIFSLTLASLSSLSLKSFFPYLRETKFSDYRQQILGGIFIIVLLTSILPSVITAARFESEVGKEVLEAFGFLNKEDTTILAPYKYGHAIAFLGNRNVADSKFLLAPSPKKRLEDINLVYTSQSEALVLEVIGRYDVEYIIFDDFVRERFGVEELIYVKDENCFLKIYENYETEVYEIKC